MKPCPECNVAIVKENEDICTPCARAMIQLRGRKTMEEFEELRSIALHAKEVVKYENFLSASRVALYESLKAWRGYDV